MGHLTDDDLKAILTKAAEYKKSEADRIQAMIAEAKTHVERLEAELKRWEALIPIAVYDEMQEDERRKTWETKRDEEKAYFDRVNAADAARQVGIDQMKYGLWGALGGVLLGWIVGRLFG